MAIIDAYGLSQSNTVTLGNVTFIRNSKGVSYSDNVIFAKANLNVTGLGLSQSNTIVLGKLVKFVKITNIVALSSSRIRITFDRPMLKNALLISSASYIITPVTPGAASVFFTEVETENTTYPTFVDLITSEMTNGNIYNCLVSTIGPTDLEGTNVDPAYNNANFTGIGEIPYIEKLEAISENRINVVFNELMDDNSDIRNPTKYVFNNGLSVISVLDVTENIVKLVTSNQVPGLLYKLTVNP